MSKNSAVEFQDREDSADPLTECLRVGAKRFIQQALEAKLAELLERHSDRVTGEGKAGVVRNGIASNAGIGAKVPQLV